MRWYETKGREREVRELLGKKEENSGKARRTRSKNF